MGRVKLEIKKLENNNGRHATYFKRKNGILKKANELSILCDVDIILLMFSPSGKPSLCRGTRSMEEIIEKFAQLTPQERAKRKLESLEALKKTFKKLDHDVNIEDFLGASNLRIEKLSNQAMIFHSQLSELHGRLSYWSEPEQINNVEHLEQMENSIRQSLDQIRAHKENFGKQQVIPLECSSQIQDSLQIPFEQQLQSLPWISNDDARHNGLKGHNLIPHRDMECSGSTSFGSYSGYFGTLMSSDLSNSGQENGVLDELNGNMPMKQIANEQQQYSYFPNNLSLLHDMKQQHQPLSAAENLPVIQEDYPFDRILDAPEAAAAAYDPTRFDWNPSSVPCSESLFDEPLFFQEFGITIDGGVSGKPVL